MNFQVTIGPLGTSLCPYVGPLRQRTTFSSVPSNVGPVTVKVGGSQGIKLYPGPPAPGAPIKVDFLAEDLASVFVSGTPGDGVGIQTNETIS